MGDYGSGNGRHKAERSNIVPSCPVSRYNGHMRRFIIVFIITSLAAACAHVVSKQVRTRAVPQISIPSLFADPDAFIGETVILGGTIAGSRNTGEGTYLEVVEKMLDYRGRPKYTDRSLGRFLVFHEGFIDSAIYARGRHVTVAGEVLGKKVQPLGEINYSYVFIKALELHMVQPGGGFPVHIGIGVSSSF